MSNESGIPSWLVLILVLIAIILFVARRERETPEAREKRLAEEARLRAQVDADRKRLLGQSVHPGIREDLRAFRSGLFNGEDPSPLAWIGYRVGKTRGLSRQNRRIRLEYCFGMEFPSDLAAKYPVTWGRPATSRRYDSISRHLKMLADQRRSNPSLSFAVADWDEDRAWFASEFGEMSDRFRRGGFAE